MDEKQTHQVSQDLNLNKGQLFHVSCIIFPMTTFKLQQWKKVLNIRANIIKRVYVSINLVNNNNDCKISKKNTMH